MGKGKEKSPRTRVCFSLSLLYIYSLHSLSLSYTLLENGNWRTCRYERRAWKRMKEKGCNTQYTRTPYKQVIISSILHVYLHKYTCMSRVFSSYHIITHLHFVKFFFFFLYITFKITLFYTQYIFPSIFPIAYQKYVSYQLSKMARALDASRALNYNFKNMLVKM